MLSEDRSEPAASLLRRRVAALLKSFLSLRPDLELSAAQQCVAAAQEVVGINLVRKAVADAAAVRPSSRKGKVDVVAAGEMTSAIRTVQSCLALTRSRSSVHTSAAGVPWRLDHSTWSGGWVPPRSDLSHRRQRPQPKSSGRMASEEHAAHKYACTEADAAAVAPRVSQQSLLFSSGIDVGVQTSSDASPPCSPMTDDCSPMADDSSPLATDWEAASDGESGQRYFWNTKTRESTWNRPQRKLRRSVSVHRPCVLVEDPLSPATVQSVPKSPASSSASPAPVLDLADPLLSPRALPDFDELESEVVGADETLSEPWPSCRFSHREIPDAGERGRLFHAIDQLLLDDTHADGPSEGEAPVALQQLPAPSRGMGTSAADAVATSDGKVGVVFSERMGKADVWFPGRNADAAMVRGLDTCSLKRVEAVARLSDVFCAVVPSALTPQVVAAHFCRFVLSMRRAVRGGHVTEDRSAQVWRRLLKLCRVWLTRVPAHLHVCEVRRRMGVIRKLAPADGAAAAELGLFSGVVAEREDGQSVGKAGRLLPSTTPDHELLRPGDEATCAEQLAMISHLRLRDLAAPLLPDAVVRGRVQTSDASRLNELMNWTASHILVGANAEQRADAYRRLTLIAHRALMLGDCAASQALFCGVKHREVQRLRDLVGSDVLRGQLPPQGLEVEFKELEEVNSLNFKYFQDAITDAVALTEGAAAVPFLGDVMNRIDGNTEVVRNCKQRRRAAGDTGHEPYLDWRAFRRFGTLIVKIQVLQSRRFTFAVDEKLRNVLVCLSGGVCLEQRSREIEALSPRRIGRLSKQPIASRPGPGDAVIVTTAEDGELEGTVSATSEDRTVYTVNTDRHVLHCWPAAAIQKVEPPLPPLAAPAPPSPRSQASGRSSPWPINLSLSSLRSPTGRQGGSFSPRSRRRYVKPRSPAGGGGWVLVHVKRAQGVAAKDMWGTSDPYVTVAHGHYAAENMRTRTKSQTLDAAWTFAEGAVLCPHAPGNGLTLQAWDRDRVTKDDFLGEVFVSVAEAGNYKLPLQPRQGSASDAKTMRKNGGTLGVLHFEIKMMSDAAVRSMPYEDWKSLAPRVFEA
eukprot:TRINITY_DN7738_c0_g2_i1.p1 TRINITY_DN7738_c0_g2~~TRINITY_DN7738_c0_g2_i1.p1  ORF type:complete len:1112 (+),score=196.79 TRINITY_DN7738_c0_g2_i1:92-3337(+)